MLKFRKGDFVYIQAFDAEIIKLQVLKLCPDKTHIHARVEASHIGVTYDTHVPISRCFPVNRAAVASR